MSVSSIVVTDQHGVLSKLPFHANQKKQYKIKLADIIRQIDVVSSQSLADMYRNGITIANLGSNVSAIGISCFADCRNLTTVSANPYALNSQYLQQLNSFKRVEESAFINCKSLTSVSFLDESNKTNPKGMQIVDYIGQEAFANTGLTAAYVPLRRSTGETFIMPSAFANCQSLKHAENVVFNYLGPYEFANCRNLTSVKMTDYHAYSYECTFKDCVSLKHVDIPAKLWRIGDSTFEGCTHLTSLTFLDSPDNKSELSQNGCYGNLFLSGTGIKSLTFPSCVVDWTPFNDFTLSGMSKLRHIKFNGIPFTKLGEKIVKKTITVDTHHLIFEQDSSLYDYLIDINSYGVKKIEQYLYKGNNTLFKLASKSIQLGYPTIVIQTNSNGDCGYCHTLDKNALITKEFLNWVRDENNKCLIYVGLMSSGWFSDLPENNSAVVGDNYPAIYGVWIEKKDDGTKEIHKFLNSNGGKNRCQDTFTTPNRLISEIKKFSKGFKGLDDKVSWIVDADILASAVFGLGHSVVLESKEGKTLSVDGDFLNKNLGFLYEQEEVVDRHTGAKGTNTSQFFKFGQWYYNVKQLREVANKYHIPMFVELGSSGCGPCEEFEALVYQNANFQKFMKNSKILLCRTVSYSSGYPGQSGYTYNWTGKFGSPPYNQQGRMPIMFLYWNSLSASQNIQTGEYIQGEKYQFASFNTTSQSTSKEFPVVHDWNEITSLITSVSSEWQLSTVAQQTQQAGTSLTAFNKPSTKHHKDKKLKNWYNSYRFDESDTYGAYYPVKLFDNVKASYTVYLSVGSDSATSYTLNPYDHSTHANYNAISGIYQYFTMPYPGEDAAESAIANFKATYDMAGILFSIGPSTKQTLSNSMTYSYRSKTLDAFRSSYQLTASKIASQSWSYLFTDVYAHDSWSGDPVEPIAIVPDYFDNGQKTYNAVYECKTKNLAYSKVVVFISGDVKVANKEIAYEHNDDEHLYVVSAYFYKTTTDSEARLQWLSAFTNASGYDSELE